MNDELVNVKLQMVLDTNDEAISSIYSITEYSSP